MSKFDNIKYERAKIQNHLSLPLSQERSRIDISNRDISGYAIVWDSLNDFNEIVRKGACEKSINARGINSTTGNKIQLLLQHDRNRILGTLIELREDDYGLFFRATISEGIQYCEEALIQIREGLLKQLSYGFGYIWDDGAVEYDSDRDILFLNEIRLHELSLVTWSSDPNAQLRYSASQAQLRLSQFNAEQIRNITEALNILSDTDEVKNSKKGALGSLISKF